MFKLEINIGGNIRATVEGASHKEIFERVAELQELFGDPASAEIDGKVHVEPNTIMVVRDSTYNDGKKEKTARYYERRVVSGPLAGFRKDYGCKMEGDALFPKRPDNDRKDIVRGFNGWYKYVGSSN